MALTLQATASAAEVQVTDELGAIELSDILIEEDNPLLLNKLVQGQVNWGDGSIVSLSDGATPSPLSVPKLSHSFAPGYYNVTLTAFNYRSPVPDSKTRVFPFSVVKTVSATDPLIGDVFGFILPKDEGYPNKDQWMLNSGSGVEIVQSSVKMILSTARGERVMDPAYGTNLRRLVFEQMSDDIQGFAEQEIKAALAFEPRAKFSHLTVERGRSSIVIRLRCVYNKTPFEVVETYPI